MDKKLTIIAAVLFSLVIVGAIYICLTFSNKNELVTNTTIDEEEISNNSNVEQSNATTEISYNDDEYDSYDCDSSYKKLFSNNGLTVYENPNYKKDEYNDFLTKYCVINDKTKSKYSSFIIGSDFDKENYDSDEKIDNYFFRGDDETRGMFNLKSKKILYGYDDFSCTFHTDESAYYCSKSYTTMISNYTNNLGKVGLVSLDDYKILIPIDYDIMNELYNGNFVVTKNNKYGLYSNTGKLLLDVSYDYLGYSSYLGYIGIKGNNVEFYNADLVKQTIETDTIKNALNNAIKKYNSDNKEKSDFLYLNVPESYTWSVGTTIKLQNMNSPFLGEDDQYLYKYSGKSFSGEQLVINSECFSNDDTFVYVIEGDKATRITKKDLNIPEGYPSYCF